MRNPTMKRALVTGLRASQTAFAGPHADSFSLFPSPEMALPTSGLARHVDGKQLASLAGRAH